MLLQEVRIFPKFVKNLRIILINLVLIIILRKKSLWFNGYVRIF